MIRTLKLLYMLTVCAIANAQTLRINEFSNGTAGSKEWIELLVAPTSPTPPVIRGCFNTSLNIAGWVIDDNDGTFSPPNNNFGSGFATGHLRFRNVEPWTRLPIGAIIVIYNNADKEATFPADDPYDINNDCVYVLPANHISLESCTTAPVALTCSTTTSYAGCTTYGPGNWLTINAANAGDGMQIRDASYNLIHGIVYGRTTTSSCGAAASMVGNAVSPLLATTNGAGVSYTYNGLDLPGYFDATKWTLVPAASSTPGAYNNTNNQVWIQDTIRKGCICSVLLDHAGPQTYLPIRSTDFSYQVCGNAIVFTANVISKIDLSVYASDGRLVDRIITTVKGKYIYRVTHPFMNIINGKVTVGYGGYLSFTSKIVKL